MEFRRVVWSLTGAALAAAAGTGWFARPSDVPVAGAPHAFLHLNCPPGSHGVPRTDGIGRSLMDARNAKKPAE
jgi:hypothetical protein